MTLWPKLKHPKRKGDNFRRDVQRYLAEHCGLQLTARGVGMAGDDLRDAEWSVEAKACQRVDLAAFTDQAVRQAGPTHRPLLVVKRRNVNVQYAYAVMPLWAFADLVRDHDN